MMPMMTPASAISTMPAPLEYPLATIAVSGRATSRDASGSTKAWRRAGSARSARSMRLAWRAGAAPG